jgi:SAM-dependent methyltransferase
VKPFPKDAFHELSKVEEKNWWFRSRNAIILWFFKNKILPFKNFLEVGCGTGFVMQVLSRHFDFVSFEGIEFFGEGLEFARNRVPIAKFSPKEVTKMELYQKYDAIGAFDVLEHIEQDMLALEKISQSLKPGGSLVITVPQHKWLWSAIDDYACHARRYTKSEIHNKVIQSGLEIKYSSSFVFILLPLMLISRLFKRKEIIDPLAEFKIPRGVNWVLEIIMKIECFFLKIGVCFPLGGSRFLHAIKPH